MTGYLIFTAVVVGLAAITYFAPRRHRKPDDLMALNEALHRCGTLLRSYMPNHVWHDCDRPKGLGQLDRHRRGDRRAERDLRRAHLRT